MTSTAPMRKADYGRLGAKIREARSNLGLTQSELAKALHVTAGAVGQWEIGLTKPRLDKLTALSAILNLSLSELLGLSEAHEGTASRVEPPSSPEIRPKRTHSGSIDLDRGLLDLAQSFGIDVANELNTHLRELVSRARAEQWLRENREALADANAFLAREGLWSDGKRQF